MNGHAVDSRQCAQCAEVVFERDIHDHILNCRPNARNEKQPCPSSAMKKCAICEDFVEDLASHCQTCGLEDEKNTSGYETPRGQTPIQVCEHISSSDQVKRSSSPID